MSTVVHERSEHGATPPPPPSFDHLQEPSVSARAGIGQPSAITDPSVPAREQKQPNRKRKTTLSQAEPPVKSNKKARTARHKSSTNGTKEARPTAKREQLEQQSVQHIAANANPDVPLILPPLPRRIMAKVHAMKAYITLVDDQAGIEYANIDAYGLGDPTHTCLPANDFLAAMKILAADLDLEPPDTIDLARGSDMISNTERSLLPAGISFQWAIVDFTKSNDIEARAQALIGDRGFRGRNLLGIECCMQAWRRAQLTAAGLPVPGYRQASNAGLINGNPGAWTHGTSRNTDMQGHQHVRDNSASQQAHVQSSCQDLYDHEKLKSASSEFALDVSPWLRQTSSDKYILRGDDQLSPKSIATHSTKEPVRLSRPGVCPDPPADFL